MKIAGVRVTEVTIGKNESGNYEYQDTKRAVNAGEKAFMLKSEDAITGSINKVFFQDKTKAEKFN
jgi:hypothetical protein